MRRAHAADHSADQPDGWVILVHDHGDTTTRLWAPTHVHVEEDDSWRPVLIEADHGPPWVSRHAQNARPPAEVVLTTGESWFADAYPPWDLIRPHPHEAEPDDPAAAPLAPPPLLALVLALRLLL